MAKYDDASWHYKGDFSYDLPKENGSTHIGMFINWCIDNDLLSMKHTENNKGDIEKVKNRIMTGAEYLINNCDEKFNETDLTQIGNAFTIAYYENDTEFRNVFPNYLNDYSSTFNTKAKKKGFEYETIYHVENTIENYKLLKPVIDKRFAEWKVLATIN